MIKRLAEWEKQDSVWLCYPSHTEHWGKRLGEIREFVLKLVRLISDYQAVDFIFNDDRDLKQVESLLGQTTFQVRCHILSHNDIWVRDYGPLFVSGVENSKIIKFGFNAWGGKFPPYDLDASMPFKIGDFLKLEVNEIPLIVEGGALEFNGEGLALSTEPCLFGESRNPGVELAEIREKICRALNLDHLFVFSEGLIGDHTDGHIDNIARFVRPQTLLLAMANENDPQFEVCEALFSQSQALKELMPELELVRIPLPESKFHEGEILSRSYLNFIFVNGAMIVPTFNERNDQSILNLLQDLIPDRKVIGLDCTELVLEGGGLHCMTCHQPSFQSH